MKVYDLLLDADLDLSFRGGDLDVGESTEQHQQLLLLSEPGDWRENPAVGVGIQTMLLDDAGGVAMLAAITDQLEADGQVITELTMTAEGALFLLAAYHDDNNG